MQAGQIQSRRVVSGMRATGVLHLGHYQGVLKNWVKMQHEYECLFFAADWHALTTHYVAETQTIKPNVIAMVVDWLAAGLNPGSATIFVQSHVPELAELHLLLSMITPLGWLERVPTYKDQLQKLQDRDIETHGFLGYPVLMTADVLLYKAGLVPVGEDQLPHLELSREIARRFNHLYGREENFQEKAEGSIKKLSGKDGKLYREYLQRYQQEGVEEALAMGRALIEAQQNLQLGDKERLLGFLEGGGRIILPEPQALLTQHSRMPGLDGQKMSKSYNNVINLREAPEVVEQKIMTMPTDPARVRRQDPGEPEKCAVWDFHKIYSNETTQEWAAIGCRTAGIGCVECKRAVIKPIQEHQAPMIERGKEFEANPKLVRSILMEGSDSAREIARETLTEVREAIGLDY